MVREGIRVEKGVEEGWVKSRKCGGEGGGKGGGVRRGKVGQ